MNIKDKTVLLLVQNEYNKYITECLQEKKVNDISQFEITKKDLNNEFNNRAIHIDNGNYCLISGIESISCVRNIKDDITYKLTNQKIIGDKKNKIIIDFIG